METLKISLLNSTLFYKNWKKRKTKQNNNNNKKKNPDEHQNEFFLKQLKMSTENYFLLTEFCFKRSEKKRTSKS